jgi:hypothetical protein
MTAKISTIEIKLTNSNQVALIDAKNQDLTKYQYYLKSGYVARVEDRKTKYLHHDVLNIKGKQTVKFRNKDHLDCRQENLVVDEFKRLLRERQEQTRKRKLANKAYFIKRVPLGPVSGYRLELKNNNYYLWINVNSLPYYMGMVSSDEEAQDIIHKLEER